MALTKCGVVTNNISGLPDSPSLSSSELKEKFDKSGADIKTYINDTLTEEIEDEISGAETRAKAEFKKTYKYSETTTADIEEDEEHTVPTSYTVASGNLDVFIFGTLMTLNEHYEEVGTGTSTKIRFKFDVPSGSQLIYVIRK